MDGKVLTVNGAGRRKSISRKTKRKQAKTFSLELALREILVKPPSCDHQNAFDATFLCQHGQPTCLLRDFDTETKDNQLGQR